MNIKRFLAVVMAVVIVASCAVITTSAVDSDDDKIIVHYKSENGTPMIYYWNSLPENIEVKYPGVEMSKDSAQGADWYTYTFDNVTKINMMFIVDGEQSKELSRTSCGEYWYKKNRWYTRNPETVDQYDRTDLREDSIYFVVTTRFYDGDTGNNVHCWEDYSTYNNPDSDPAWRGDFKGLIEKLDYIKALGFSAVWVTPVVENASGYDYHGYHAFDLSKVDPRYESDGATFQDLIDACHEKDMKIIQDVVWNHVGNFGEANLCELFTKDYTKDLGKIEESMIPTEKLLDTYGLKSAEEYWAQPGSKQHSQRLNIMKDLTTVPSSESNPPYSPQAPDRGTQAAIDNEYKVQKDGSTYNSYNYFHNDYWKNVNWDDFACKYVQIAGDCVDLNTENPAVAEYTVDVYKNYINMGVDAFRVDTVRHMPRLSLNMMYLPELTSAADNFYMFGETCTRYGSIWYREHASESTQFYTWKETDPSYADNWSWGSDAASVSNNMDLTLQHWAKNDNNFAEQPTSKNAFLDGNKYHTPDYSQFSGLGGIDFTMHYNFNNASSAFNLALQEDKYFNDSTWNVVYVDSHDYSPGPNDYKRFDGGTQQWAENLNLMFTFRGIPCIYYGSEVEFKKGVVIDGGADKIPLEETGRAYFGDHLEGTVTATDFSEYTASGEVAETLNYPLAQHIQRLNQIRRAIPALQKGQYSTTGCDGSVAYKRRYTEGDIDSYALITVSGKASFTGIENGTYYEVITGQKVNVTDGKLTSDSVGQGNMRVYVLDTPSNTVKGKIGTDGTYLK